MQGAAVSSWGALELSWGDDQIRPAGSCQRGHKCSMMVMSVAAGCTARLHGALGLDFMLPLVDSDR